MMKIQTFTITMVALMEIAVGVGLLLTSPIASQFLVDQGIDDLIFTISCVSGHFSWRSYRSHKIISLVTSVVSTYKTFASKSGGMPYRAMKEKVLYTETKLITRTKMIDQLCRRVLTHAAEGVAYGASFALIDHLIHSFKDVLVNSLDKFVFSDIDYTIANHDVLQGVIELNRNLGEKKAGDIVKRSLYQISNRYKEQIQKTFDAIDIRFLKVLIERTIHKSFNMLKGPNRLVEELNKEDILRAFADIKKILKSATYITSHFKEISNLVSDILNDVHEELKLELKNLPQEYNADVVDQDRSNVFQSEVLIEMKCVIKKVFSEYVENKVVLPVAGYVQTCVGNHAAHKICKTRNYFLTNEEIDNFSKMRNQSSKEKKEESATKGPDFLSSEFDQITNDVLNSRRNRKILSDLMLENSPVNTYCLRLFLNTIPSAFQQNGLKVPNFKVEVEENGYKQGFSIGNAKVKAPTLHINRDSDFVSNVKNNKGLVTDLFNFLCKSFLEHYPEYRGLTSTLLQEMVVKTINSYCTSQTDDDSGTKDGGSNTSNNVFDCRNPVPLKVGQLNPECEKKTPYQHILNVKGWVFSPSVDIDLREKGELTNLSHIQKHVSKGFEIALFKVNTHIHSIQTGLDTFNLVLDDFAETRHQLAPPLSNMSELFHCYSVQYELVVPVMLKGPNRLVEFYIVLFLVNEKPVKTQCQKSPLGPHIVYKIDPVTEVKFMNKGIKGHILLNIDCTIASYSIKDCRVAGELILSSALQYPTTSSGNTASTVEELMSNRVMGNQEPRKVGDAPKSPLLPNVHANTAYQECDVIILGDSLFKYINDYITLPKCHCGIFPHLKLKQFRGKIMSFLTNYRDIKCIVLFFGNDMVKTNVPEEKLLTSIFDMVKDIQKSIRNVKVIMYSLVLGKLSANKYNEKISNANRILMEYCLRENVAYEDSTRIICPRDLGKDGIHLNRSGYHKLGKHISEICKAI